MIIKFNSNRFNKSEPETFVSNKQLLKLFNKRDFYKNDLLKEFKVNTDELEVFQVGNSKELLEALLNIDSKCDKVDISTNLNRIHLKKLLEGEKAVFEVLEIENDFILIKNGSDILELETRYSAKHDILDEYSLSKFANYCRDHEYDDLINTIEGYLQKKNLNGNREIGLRLIYIEEENKFFIRSKTSKEGYKDFGNNFSTFVALVILGRYVTKSGQNIFIDSYRVDDSTLYVSFQLSKVIPINNDLKLSVNLTLENNEIGKGAVSFNGVCKLSYLKEGRESEIFIKPKGIKKKETSYAVDLLTYAHRGKVSRVYDQLQVLPELIDLFIKQISDEAPRISRIENPEDVKKLIARKVKASRKKEFQKYRIPILNKLTAISVDNTFKLFELLREVEDLFEHQDVLSRDFWREKLYESLIKGK